jgi:hypothetical protein
MPNTTTPNINHARGVLAEVRDEMIVFTKPETDYQLHLKVLMTPSTPVGKRIVGTIRAEARRVDVCGTGGAYVEPVYGRPRRVQGEIIAVDTSAGTITVHAGLGPIVCKLSDARQRAEHFSVGDFVTFAVLPGATFTPA